MLIMALLLSTLQSATPAVVDQPPATKEDPNKKICRRMQATGSYLMTKECHTKAEWDLMAENARNALVRQRSGFKGKDN